MLKPWTERRFVERGLTAAEWTQISRGLAEALHARRVRPRIRPVAHPAATIAALWFGSRPIIAIGSTIWWPGAPSDFAGSSAMAILQHELQHVLDYAQGRMSVGRYLLWPPNWRYELTLTPDLRWERLGAEQRATAAEALWRSERSGDVTRLLRLRELVPWAHDGD